MNNSHDDGRDLKRQTRQNNIELLLKYKEIAAESISALGKNVGDSLVLAAKQAGAGAVRLAKSAWEASAFLRAKTVVFAKAAGRFLTAPARRAYRYCARMVREVKAAKHSGGTRAGVKALGFYSGKLFFGKNGIAVTAFNYALPVVSIAFLFNIVAYATSIQYGTKLYVNGQLYGYVQDETVFAEAEQLVQDRITYLSGNDHLEFTESYESDTYDGQETLTKQEIADRMLATIDADVEEGYALYVGEELYGIVKDKTRIENTLESLLDKYRTGVDGERVEFVKSIRFDDGLYLTDSITNDSGIISRLTEMKSVDAYYTVVDGDSPSLIADKLDISMTELYQLNPWLEAGYVYTGDQVLSHRAEPFLTVRITRTEVYEQETPYETEYVDDSSRYEGGQYTYIEGVPGTEQVTADVSYINGYETSRNVLSTVKLTDPENEVIYVGTKQRPSGLTSTEAGTPGKFIWPVGNGGGAIYEQMYGYGGYYGHKGIDISYCEWGTPIWAADSGTVVKVGWDPYGYGNYVIIEHASGWRTLYAHMSDIHVSTWQEVTQGDWIGDMGSTGRSTGTHLHFEVITPDGYNVNPPDYLPYH